MNVRNQLASLPGHSFTAAPKLKLGPSVQGLLGVHSRYGLTLALPPIRDTLIEGFSHFVTSMTAPIASGWSGRRVGFAPLESAAFSRRRQKRTFGRHSQSSCLKRSAHLLLVVGLCHLAYQLGPIHIHRSIDRTGLGPTIVFESFDHQRRVVR